MASHGGGRRYLSLWWPLRDDETEESLELAYGRIHEVELPARSGEAGVVVVKDLFEPGFVSRNGELYLYGTAQNYRLWSNPESPSGDYDGEFPEYMNYTVWVAQVEPREDLLDTPALDETHLAPRTTAGQAIVRGTSPRIVAAGEGFILSVRRPGRLEELGGQSKLFFFRSADLSEWTLDAAMSGIVTAAPGYAIAKTSVGVSVATVTAGETPRLALRRFDTSQGEWLTAGSSPAYGPEVHDASERVWFVGAETGLPSGGARVVYRQASDGEVAFEH
jgi:hypothetical protein